VGEGFSGAERIFINNHNLGSQEVLKDGWRPLFSIVFQYVIKYNFYCGHKGIRNIVNNQCFLKQNHQKTIDKVGINFNDLLAFFIEELQHSY
jgi:hypothetical protein